MTTPRDKNEAWDDQPNLVGEMPPSFAPSRDLMHVFLMALPGPVLLGVMMVLKPDYEIVLFTNSLGLKMLSLALAVQLMGMVVQISFRTLFSKNAPGFVSVLMGMGVGFFYYLPIIFVVFVGPATIAIYERLLRR